MLGSGVGQFALRRTVRVLKYSCALGLVAGISACNSGTQAEKSSSPSLDSPTPSGTPTSSTGPLLIDVPDLRKYTRDQALSVLRDIGLPVVFIEVQSAEPVDTIVDQRPHHWERVEPGTEIRLFYAVPKLYQLTAFYEVFDARWRELGDGECDHPELGFIVGKSVRVEGPDGVSLGAALISEPGDIEDENHRKIGGPGVGVAHQCSFVFRFAEIPNVASYTLVAPDGTTFPEIPRAEVFDGNSSRGSFRVFWSN